MAVGVWERQLICSLDSFPGSDVPGEYMLVETNLPCISTAANTVVERLHDGSVSDVSKTELISLPRFRLSFFLLVLTIIFYTLYCWDGGPTLLPYSQGH